VKNKKTTAMIGEEKEGEKKKRGRPKKGEQGNGASKTSNFFGFASTSTTQVPISNQYEQLNDDEDLSETDSMMEIISQSSKKLKFSNSKNDKPAQPRAAPKPPPFNIKGKSFAEVQQILAATNIPREKFQTKLTPQGIRVFAENDEVYQQINAKLKATETKFFTHQLRNEQTTKFVLHGLYKMTENELQEKLVEAKINPSQVKILTVRQQKYSDHCVYLLHFPKTSKMKISTLRETKAIEILQILLKDSNTSTIYHEKVFLILFNYKLKCLILRYCFEFF
jgi:hypothetical protein